jgi:hypothetical protein
MANGPIAPNLYVVSGSGVHVTYSTESFGGGPQFTYQDATVSRTFSGGEIRTEQTELGTLVSVTLSLTPDFGSTAFTLVVPKVNLSTASSSVPIHTFGVTTLHRTSIIGPIGLGQTETYTVKKLAGHAEIVRF